jgi:hypothetical protein
MCVRWLPRGGWAGLLLTARVGGGAVVIGGWAAGKEEVKSLAAANAACNGTDVQFDDWPLRTWPSCLPGYSAHLAASFGEWLTALFYFAYFLSFTKKSAVAPVDVGRGRGPAASWSPWLTVLGGRFQKHTWSLTAPYLPGRGPSKTRLVPPAALPPAFDELDDVVPRSPRASAQF